MRDVLNEEISLERHAKSCTQDFSWLQPVMDIHIKYIANKIFGASPRTKHGKFITRLLGVFCEEKCEENRQNLTRERR